MFMCVESFFQNELTFEEWHTFSHRVQTIKTNYAAFAFKRKMGNNFVVGRIIQAMLFLLCHIVLQ